MGGLVVHVDLALLGLAALPVLLVAGPVARVRGVQGAVRLVQLLAQGRSAVHVPGDAVEIGDAPSIVVGEGVVPGVVLAVAPAHGHGVEIFTGLEPVAVGVLGPEPARAARGRGLIEHVDIVQRAGGEVEVLVVVLLPLRRAFILYAVAQLFGHSGDGEVSAGALQAPAEGEAAGPVAAAIGVLGDVAPENLVLHIPPAGGAAALGGDIHRAVAQGGGIGIFHVKFDAPV